MNGEKCLISTVGENIQLSFKTDKSLSLSIVDGLLSNFLEKGITIDAICLWGLYDRLAKFERW